jgi:hypothetical protein
VQRPKKPKIELFLGGLTLGGSNRGEKVVKKSKFLKKNLSETVEIQEKGSQRRWKAKKI